MVQLTKPLTEKRLLLSAVGAVSGRPAARHWLQLAQM